jgi:chromosome partitioning protein
MRRIAIAGLKGGIGKTTVCVNLGAALALRGQRVLLIDTDTQANLSLALGASHYEKSLPDILLHHAVAEECVLPVRHNLSLLPSSLSLFKAQQRMVMELAREEIFIDAFSELTGYDYILVDCAPSVSLLTVNTVAYVDEVFVPVSMEPLALTGAHYFVRFLKDTGEVLGKEASVRLIIPTFYDARRRVSELVLQTLIKDYGSRVARPIRVDPELSEAPGAGQTVFEYAPRGHGATDFARLADRVEQMLSPPAGAG